MNAAEFSLSLSLSLSSLSLSLSLSLSFVSTCLSPRNPSIWSPRGDPAELTQKENQKAQIPQFACNYAEVLKWMWGSGGGVGGGGGGKTGWRGYWIRGEKGGLDGRQGWLA